MTQRASLDDTGWTAQLRRIDRAVALAGASAPRTAREVRDADVPIDGGGLADEAAERMVARFARQQRLKAIEGAAALTFFAAACVVSIVWMSRSLRGRDAALTAAPPIVAAPRPAPDPPPTPAIESEPSPAPIAAAPEVMPAQASVTTAPLPHLTAHDWMSRGEEGLAVGEMQAALGAFEKARDLDSSLAPASIGMGRAYLGLGKPHAAAVQFRRALRVAPDDPEALYLLGSTLEQLGEAEQAIEYYARYASLYSSGAHADAVRALLARLRGEAPRE